MSSARVDSGNHGTAVAPRRKRADAERNIAAILDAAIECFGVNPAASMTEIARAAGVGRVTLYAHFPSREDVVDAAVRRSLSQTATVLDDAELVGRPADAALAQVVRSSWQVVNRNRGLYAVVSREMPPEALRQLHDPLHERLAALIERGQSDGLFRLDLPLSWLIATVYNLMHGAAEEVQAGRLDAGEAGEVLVTTIGAVLRAQHGPAAHDTTMRARLSNEVSGVESQ